MRSKLAVFGGAVLVFLISYLAMRSGASAPLDEYVARWAMHFRDAKLTPFLRFITDMYAPSAAVAFMVAVVSVLVILRRFYLALYYFLTVTGALFVKIYLKFHIMRPRPPYKILDIGGYSFPSGHATLSMVTGIGLYLIARAVRGRDALTYAVLGTALLWAGLVGFTRLYFGVHWFSDIVAGWALGLGWAYLTALLFFPKKG